MLYVGTSLGQCLRSLLDGEVSYDQVLLIITNTRAPTKEDFIKVVEMYHQDPPKTTYDYSHISWDIVSDLASNLWEDGKIHQPRNFNSSNLYKRHYDLSSDIWIEVSPKSRNTTVAVKDAYEKYKMLDMLTK
jgi:hypothetical protein